MAHPDADEQRRFRLFPLLQLQLVSVLLQTRDRDWPRQWPADFAGDGIWRLWWQAQDGLRLRIGSRWRALPAEELILLPPGTAFTVAATGPVRQLAIHARCGAADGLLEQVLAGRHYRVPADRLASILQPLIIHDSSDPRLDPVIGNHALALLHQVLAQVCTGLDATRQRRLEASSSDPAVLDLVAAIVAEPAGDWSNARLAERLSCPVNRLIQRFRRVCDQTPARFVLRQRLRLAERRLCETDQAIDVIAASCGFADRYHLAHRFSAVYGRGPATYRRDSRQEAFSNLVPPRTR
ncbi:MAG: helix-turn-helix domain-containing protein [Planctomycetota bacterium]